MLKLNNRTPYPQIGGPTPMSNKPGPGRAELGFREAVLSNFRFLIDLGLHPVEEQVTLVRYESQAVFINIYHGRSSYALAVEIGRLDHPTVWLSIDDIIAWAGAEEAEGFGQHDMPAECAAARETEAA
jgi:hypothetical protein